MIARDESISGSQTPLAGDCCPFNVVAGIVDLCDWIAKNWPHAPPGLIYGPDTPQENSALAGKHTKSYYDLGIG
jgi:hypothetical protein